MNHKGIVTFDRKTKKDSFYIYKAWWNSEPFVHICGSRYVDRLEAMTTVKVYSNQPKVALYANGKLVEEVGKCIGAAMLVRAILRKKKQAGTDPAT